MADVAKLAGVSAMTVSRSLRQDGTVSQKTRQRVLEVIDELGYVPDQGAGALSSGHSGLIGAILPTLVSPIFGHLSRGLTDTLRGQGLQVFFGFSDYDPLREEQMLESMLRRRPEAVAIAGAEHTAKTVRMLANAGVPIVEYFDEPTAPVQHVVAIDHHAGGRAITRYLAERGRRRLAVLAPKAGFDARGDRRAAGVFAAATELGLPEPVVIRSGSPLAPVEQGVRGAGEIVERRKGVEAIVCMNDFAALGAINELRRRGVEVPDPMAVTGFGDCGISQFFYPSITTISFNAVSVGVEIGKLMLSALDSARQGRQPAPFRLAVECQLVARESA